MNILAIFFATFLLTCKTPSVNQLGKTNQVVADTENKVTQIFEDTTIKIQSGFYLAFDDTSKTQGFKLYNKDEYYFLGTSPAVTMAQVDTVYKDFNSNFNGHILVFRFNEQATKNWFDFTQKNLGLKVGLVVDNKIIYVATIMSAISGGVSSLAGSYTEKEIDDFLTIFKDEIKVAKETQ